MDSDEEDLLRNEAADGEGGSSSSEDEDEDPMKVITENVTAETKKTDYNPEIDTNWCSLPVEMRLECIKRMDYPDQFQMRNTSHAERRLVDSQKLEFECLFIVFSDQFYAAFTSKNCDVIFQRSPDDADYKKGLRDTAQLLKMAVVKQVMIIHDQKIDEPPEEFIRLAPYRFTNLFAFSYVSVGWQPDLFFLDSSVMPVKFLSFRSVQFIDFLTCKVPRIFTLPRGTVPRDLPKYIEKWIADDVEVGTKLTCTADLGTNFQWIPRALRDRKISCRHRHYRYRTDNDAKEIHMKIGGIREFGRYHRRASVEFEMIAVTEPPEPKAVRTRWSERIRNRNH